MDERLSIFGIPNDHVSVYREVRTRSAGGGTSTMPCASTREDPSTHPLDVKCLSCHSLLADMNKGYSADLLAVKFGRGLLLLYPGGPARVWKASGDNSAGLGTCSLL